LVERLREYRSYLAIRGHRISCISILIVPGLLLLVSELIHRGGSLGLVRWIMAEPYYSLESLLFLSAAYVLLLSLTRSPWVTTWILAVNLIFCVSVSYNKLLIREIPLMPWNTILLKELAAVIAEVPHLALVFLLSITPALALVMLTPPTTARVR
jgi:hypothetical protein